MSNTPEPRIDAERALIRMRQGDAEEARRHLTQCLEKTDTARMEARAGDSTEAFQALYDWATEMTARLDE